MEKAVYVTGIGKTKFGKINKTLPELMYEVMFLALKDAKESVKNLDAIFIGNFGCSVFNNQLHLGSMMASLLPGIHMPIIRCENACASGGTALYEGIMSLSGFKKVLVVGVEKMNQISTFKNSKYISFAGDYSFDYKEGVLFPVAYALMAQAYMEKYGATENDLALISMKNHNNANLSPKAHFYGSKVTLKKIKTSPMVAMPLKLYDCSPISDGAAALVLSGKRQNKRDIRVAGSVLTSGYLSLSQVEDLTSIEATKVAADLVYKQAGIGADDIDLAQVHDCFTIAELIAMEDLGMCGKGEAVGLVRRGETKIGGRLPINVDGGLKGGGHPLGATGVSQVCEVVTQLRREAGKRQVKGAKIGLAHNVGGTGGTCTIHILKKE